MEGTFTSVDEQAPKAKIHCPLGCGRLFPMVKRANQHARRAAEGKESCPQLGGRTPEEVEALLRQKPKEAQFASKKPTKCICGAEVIRQNIDRHLSESASHDSWLSQKVEEFQQATLSRLIDNLFCQKWEEMTTNALKARAILIQRQETQEEEKKMPEVGAMCLHMAKELREAGKQYKYDTLTMCKLFNQINGDLGVFHAYMAHKARFNLWSLYEDWILLGESERVAHIRGSRGVLINIKDHSKEFVLSPGAENLRIKSQRTLEELKARWKFLHETLYSMKNLVNACELLERQAAQILEAREAAEQMRDSILHAPKPKQAKKRAKPEGPAIDPEDDSTLSPATIPYMSRQIFMQAEKGDAEAIKAVSNYHLGMRKFDADLRREFKGFHYTIMTKLPGENEFDIREQFFVGNRIPEDKSVGTPERFKVLSNGFDVPFRKKFVRPPKVSQPLPFMTPALESYLLTGPPTSYEIFSVMEDIIAAVAGEKPYVTTMEKQRLEIERSISEREADMAAVRINGGERKVEDENYRKLRGYKPRGRTAKGKRSYD